MRLIVPQKPLGDSIFTDIDKNEYLNELYENILYNYSLKLFAVWKERKPVDIEDALRFADLLSKSTHPKNADKHKIWAQEIVALLNEIEPENPLVMHYLGAVLSSTGNYHGIKIKAKDYHSRQVLDRFYTEFSKELMVIPAESDKQFFRSQKNVYDRLSEPYLSYSGPTSMGKSFIMRMFIKEQVQNGEKLNFALIVPTKALINEVSSKIINELRDLLAEKDYKVITSAGALALEQEHNFIFVLTPERLLYLLIKYPKMNIDYLFIDEAHKISTKDSRSTFYYKDIDMLVQRERTPHIIFASPNIPNPEVYLGLIPDAADVTSQRITTAFAPVSQVKYLLDFIDQRIQQYNEHNGQLTEISRIETSCNLCRMIDLLGIDQQTIVYINSKDKAVQTAIEYAKGKPDKGIPELDSLAKEIRNQVHKDYFLADLITKGVAYHIGYLPAAIRLQIEKLYREKKIHALFCTSTLVEGVNLPADNLFITTYRKGPGRSKMSAVDFRNLVGRVGRIEYNLYGNVFLVRLEENIDSNEFVKLLKTEVPKQELSLVTELKDTQKAQIIECLAAGDMELTKVKVSSNKAYEIMRKFALILLRDIMKDRNSTVKKAFEQHLTVEIEAKIKDTFGKSEIKPDDDINASVDQTKNIAIAIRNGLRYPSLDADGNADYHELRAFLETLYNIFKWEKYESKRDIGNFRSLRWFAVILKRWISGSGLGSIIIQTLYFANDPQNAYKVQIGKDWIPYNDSMTHRNIVISNTLHDIEQVILFSISNYFLKFTEAYKRIHKIEGSLDNDWYEYVEYGTTNPLTIMLQRNGFSRETSQYIRAHRRDYVVPQPEGTPKLKRTLAGCGNAGVEREVKDIQYNIPELFVD